MKITGVIVECNPLHNGHITFFQKARLETDADYLIAVMSGDYVQRGEPALVHKHARAEMLLQNGVDLVLELPTVFATGSAEYFARCAVGILTKLGCVNTLAFGSEDGSLSSLQDKMHLEILPPDEPNNILGVAYLKALTYHQSSIQPHTIKRIGEAYHSTEAGASIPSATAIREICLHYPEKIATLDGIPASVKKILLQENTKYLSMAAFDALLGCHLQGVTYDQLSDIFDIFPDLADKILKNRRLYMDAQQFTTMLKSKDIAFSHLKRALLHLVLGYTKADAETAIQFGYAPYSRILGMRKDARALMHTIKKCSELPLINKPAKAVKQLSPEAYTLLQKDFTSSHIYSLLSYGTIIPEETKSPLLL